MEFESLVYNTIYQSSQQQLVKVLRKMLNCGLKKDEITFWQN